MSPVKISDEQLNRLCSMKRICDSQSQVYSTGATFRYTIYSSYINSVLRSHAPRRFYFGCRGLRRHRSEFGGKVERAGLTSSLFTEMHNSMMPYRETILLKLCSVSGDCSEKYKFSSFRSIEVSQIGVVQGSQERGALNKTHSKRVYDPLIGFEQDPRFALDSDP